MDKDIILEENVMVVRKLDFGPENIILENFEEDDNVEFDGGEKSNTDIHSSISKVMIPYLGMEFNTEEDAYNFYNDYARVAGFSIRKSICHKDNKRKTLDRIYCCSCQGQRGTDKRDVNVKSHRPKTRIGCAQMKVSTRETRKFKVVNFVSSHSGHNLVSPNKSHILRSHRTIDAKQAMDVVNFDISGIPPKAALDYLACKSGGRENIGFILEDYRNYLRTKRTGEIKIGDTGGVLEYLQQMQSDDPNFFYAIQVDSDDLITIIFWADGQMKADYMYFGDVVCFDTTYKKNKECRPFALFVGVNHHKQSIVFGAAFLYDETAETFVWLFDTFANVMCGKKPVTILTDQDAAMAKALSEKWHETSHRLCIWHIYQNAAIHLSHVFSKFKTFAKDFSSCIYDYEEEDDLLEAWQVMLEKYDLCDNQWLERTFNIKEKWALVYGRQTFCADMTTTQRSESMNSVLKKYVNYKYSLLQFFQHFRRLIDDRRYEELKADLRTNSSTPVLSISVEILKHAVNVYTHEVFKLFQEELSKAYDARLDIVSESAIISEYKIASFKKSCQDIVRYDSSEHKVFCSCRKFDFGGILCSHTLKVFSFKNITRIPQFYIIRRWTKMAKKGVVEVSSQHSKKKKEISGNMKEDDEKILIGTRYKDLCRLHNQIATRAALTKEKYELAKDLTLKMIEDIDLCEESETIFWSSS